MPQPTQSWILAGDLPGEVNLFSDVAGLPLVLRHALDAKAAGCSSVHVVWLGNTAIPDISTLATDPRLGDVSLSIQRTAPSWTTTHVLVTRADRVVHRDIPKRIVRGTLGSSELIKAAGNQHDGVWLCPAGVAAQAVEVAHKGGLASLGPWLTNLSRNGRVATVTEPWLGFTTAITGRKSIRRAEWSLAWSLQKLADGFAARLINRKISIVMTRYLSKLPVSPNHVTVLCLVAAAIGSLFIARGTYSGVVIGFLLVELGSIMDGIDGELSRLKYRHSRVGQWMDTVTDDLSNMLFILGTVYALHHNGVEWAAPIGAVALSTFLFTQLSQYYLIAVVYKSGDLAAIPWAFQSTEALSARPKQWLPRIKSAIPKLLKRDLVVTLFVGLAIANRIDLVLLVWAVGAVSFGVSFTIQLIRSRPDWARAYSSSRAKRIPDQLKPSS